jgi:hypothetical protein
MDQVVAMAQAGFAPGDAYNVVDRLAKLSAAPPIAPPNDYAKRTRDPFAGYGGARCRNNQLPRGSRQHRISGSSPNAAPQRLRNEASSASVIGADVDRVAVISAPVAGSRLTSGARTGCADELAQNEPSWLAVEPAKIARNSEAHLDTLSQYGGTLRGRLATVHFDALSLRLSSRADLGAVIAKRRSLIRAVVSALQSSNIPA